MKRKGFLAAAAVLVIAGAFWAKGYYQDRYVASAFYYTQIPEDEENADSWLVDADGVKQEKGKAYDLIGYNEAGDAREVHFKKSGSAKDYYAPGAYIKVSASKTIVVGVEVVDAAQVPQEALSQIRARGTSAQ